MSKLESKPSTYRMEPFYSWSAGVYACELEGSERLNLRASHTCSSWHLSSRAGSGYVKTSQCEIARTRLSHVRLEERGESAPSTAANP